MRLAKTLSAAVAALTMACGNAPAPVDPEALHPSEGIRRLGEAVGYKKVGGVSKAIVAGDASVVFELEVPSPSRIHLAAARADDEPTDGAAPVRCTARISRADGSKEDLALLELPAGELRWVDAIGSLDASEQGTLILACANADGGPQPVIWAQPLVVPQQASGSAPPLIVLISLDTLRADYVTGFGGAPDSTPNIGKLADEGLRHLDATSEGTWTLASHYSLLFSRMYGFPVRDKPLTSLAQALSDAGFVSIALTGGGFVGSVFNDHLGFDHFAEYNTAASDDLPFVLADALPAIRRFENNPTFFFLHTFAVHESPPSEVAWHEKHGALRTFRPDARAVETAREFYAQIVKQADDDLAPLLEELRSINKTRPVLLVIISDHGEAFGEHRNFRHGFGDRHVTLHDEVVRIPIIVWGPALIAPGQSSRRPTMLVDIAPSILAAAGVAIPHSMRGSNLWPLWSSDGVQGTKPTLGSVSHTQGAWSLRTEEAKLIARMSGRQGGAGSSLYDLKDDPGEQKDVAAARPGQVAAMQAALRERLLELDVPIPDSDPLLPKCQQCGWQQRQAFWQQALEQQAPQGATIPEEIDEETFQRLKALGYID